MRRSSAWTIGASAAVAIGLILLVTSFTLNSSQDEGITLPEDTYQSFQSPTFLRGSVSGSISVMSGRLINVSVFDGPQYEEYVTHAKGTPLYEVTGNNTTFAASLNHIGRIYVVFLNDYNDTSVYVVIHFDVTGLSLDVFLAITSLFTIAVVLAVLAWRAHRKELLVPPKPLEPT